MRVGGGICTLLEETARRWLDALPLEAVVARIAAMEAEELLALARHLRPRLVPGGESPAAAVAERLVQRDAAELRELGQRLREQRAPAPAPACSGRPGGRPGDGRKNSTGRVFAPTPRWSTLADRMASQPCDPWQEVSLVTVVLYR